MADGYAEHSVRARKMQAFIAIVALLVTSLPLTPVVAANETTGGKSLSEMIVERDSAREETAKKGKKIGLGTVLSVVVGAGTALACGAFDNKNSDTKQALCTVAGLAAGYLTSLLGKAISKKLKEKDQKKLLTAASESLRTGEPKSLDLPDSGVVATVTPKSTPVQKEMSVDIFYDTARLADLNKIRVIAEPYMATNKSAVLRSTPASDGKVVGKLAANQPLYVSGQVEGSDYYLVSERVIDRDDPEVTTMMAVGYIDSKAVSPAKAEVALPGKFAPTSIDRKPVLAVMTCNKHAFELRDEAGKLTKGDSFLCRGPEGTPISA